MKIAVDCRMIKNSGIGTFLTGILEYFIHNEALNLTLIGDENEIQEIIKNNCSSSVTIVNFDAPIFSIKELIAFPVNWVNKCDIFFTPNYNIPLGIKVKIVSTIHDVIFLDIPSLTGKFGLLIRKLFVFRALKISDKVITVSEFSRNRIKNHFPWANHISIVGNGLKYSIFYYKNKLANLNRQRDYFLYVGNIKPHKGLNILLSAYEKYIENGGQIKLKIVGEKDKFKTGIDINFPKTTQKYIDFTGRVSDERLYEIIYNSYALIQPSIYEGFGIPPLEALTLGTPAIISDIPVFKEIYHSFPVIYFTSEDSNDLMKKLQLRIDNINLPICLQSKYSYKQVANTLYNIFKEL